MKPVPLTTAHRDRMSHAYRHGIGYVAVGPLDMPKHPAAVAVVCEPLVLAADGTLHFVQPPGGHKPMMMKWHPASKEWAPMHPGMGKRIGFSSAYLAAHGWTYIGTEAPEEE